MEIVKIQNYIEKIKEIQSNVLEFLEKNDDSDDDFQNLIKLLDEKKIRENRHDLKDLLYIIAMISNNHYRTPKLFTKIEKILQTFKDEIKQTFSNNEIFEIFKENKKILLFLLKEKIIILDESIYSILTSDEYKSFKFSQFFESEINQFISENKKKLTEESKELIPIPEGFEERRAEGENDSNICSLIRNDSIEQFTSFIDQNKIPLSSQIELSVYETNPFIIKNKDPTLIEYAAFFGSIQIFQFLKTNDVKLTSSLWLYAIHSNNAELIHILEENHVEPEDKTYEKCLKESIKCCHNDIANYIHDNLLDKQIEKNNLKNNFNENVLAYSFHYHNYTFLSPQFIHRFFFHYACKYDYFELVSFYLNLEGFDINMKIIKIKKKLIKFTINDLINAISKILIHQIQKSFVFVNEIE